MQIKHFLKNAQKSLEVALKCIQKDVKNLSKIWFRNGTKDNNTSSHMLLDHCICIRLVAVAFQSEVIWRRGSPWSILAPPWILTDLAKNNNTCKGPLVLHPYQVSSKSIKRFWRRMWKYEKFTDGRRDMTIGSGELKRRQIKLMEDCQGF